MAGSKEEFVQLTLALGLHRLLLLRGSGRLFGLFAGSCGYKPNVRIASSDEDWGRLRFLFLSSGAIVNM
jgi:hypothetical protein